MGKAWKALDTVAGWAEDHEERRRENNRAVLRALHTPAGMAVLGAVLLIIAGMLLINSREERRRNLERLYKAGVLSKEEYRQRLEKL